MYFKIGDTDFSMYVNALEIDTKANYNLQTNARGNSVVEYINSKRTINVGIIPLDDVSMLKLQQAIAGFNVSISFRDPKTNTLEEGVNVILPDNSVSYYTIRADKVMLKAFTLSFIEL